MAVERARMHQPGKDNLTWGSYVSNGVAGFLARNQKPADEKKPAVKTSAKKK